MPSCQKYHQKLITSTSLSIHPCVFPLKFLTECDTLLERYRWGSRQATSYAHSNGYFSFHNFNFIYFALPPRAEAQSITKTCYVYQLQSWWEWRNIENSACHEVAVPIGGAVNVNTEKRRKVSSSKQQQQQLLDEKHKEHEKWILNKRERCWYIHIKWQVVKKNCGEIWRFFFLCVLACVGREGMDFHKLWKKLSSISLPVLEYYIDLEYVCWMDIGWQILVSIECAGMDMML